MKEIITIFPFFVSLGAIISIFLFIFTKNFEFFYLFFIYIVISILFLFLNLLQISSILRIFFGIEDNPFLNFFLSLITFFYYLPYYMLSVFEKTGFFDKVLIFLSFSLPLPIFFVWCNLFYSWIVEKS